jgi:hypothetical protein
MIHSGALQGIALRGLGHLSGFGDWLKENPWFVQSVGSTINNYGEWLTAQNVKDAIKENTDKALSKDDMVALVAALQQGGFVPEGKTGTVATGADMAAGMPSWVMPVALVGGVALLMMVMKK